jgi:hypothetical protein
VAATLTVGDVSGSFTVTTTGLPDTFITGRPSNPASSASSAAFSFYSQNAAGYAASSTECSLDGAAFATCTSPASYSSLAAGTHTFNVRGSNALGADATPASYTWSVIDPADTTITSGPPAYTNVQTATFTFTSNDASATFQCSLNGAAFAACTSPFAVTGNLGSNSFSVRAVNALGADATPASATWTLDRTAPATTLSTNIFDATVYVVNTATFSFGANEQATFVCSVDGASFAACASPLSLSGLADGTHSFSVRAIDLAGNVDTVGKSRSWIVATSPVAMMSSGPSNPSAVASPTFYLSVPGLPLNQVAFDCTIDGNALSTCGSLQTIYNLRDGSHVFTYRGRVLGLDANNSVAWAYGPFQSFTLTIDLPPPETTVYTSGMPLATRTTSITFTFTSDNAGAGFDCSRDAAPWTDCSGGSQQYTALAEGTHSFSVRAKTATKVDASPATFAWQVDTTPPVVTITAHPASSSGSAAASFSFSANESGVAFSCVMDTGNFSACSSPAAYSGLAAGSHTFTVFGTDAAGNA